MLPDSPKQDSSGPILLFCFFSATDTLLEIVNRINHFIVHFSSLADIALLLCLAREKQAKFVIWFEMFLVTPSNLKSLEKPALLCLSFALFLLLKFIPHPYRSLI